jgi:hypothetical protein
MSSSTVNFLNLHETHDPRLSGRVRPSPHPILTNSPIHPTGPFPTYIQNGKRYAEPAAMPYVGTADIRIFKGIPSISLDENLTVRRRAFSELDFMQVPRVIKISLLGELQSFAPPFYNALVLEEFMEILYLCNTFKISHPLSKADSEVLRSKTDTLGCGWPPLLESDILPRDEAIGNPFVTAGELEARHARFYDKMERHQHWKNEMLKRVARYRAPRSEIAALVDGVYPAYFINNGYLHGLPDSFPDSDSGMSDNEEDYFCRAQRAEVRVLNSPDHPQSPSLLQYQDDIVVTTTTSTSLYDEEPTRTVPRTPYPSPAPSDDKVDLQYPTSSSSDSESIPGLLYARPDEDFARGTGDSFDSPIDVDSVETTCPGCLKNSSYDFTPEQWATAVALVRYINEGK